ncbi:hypothetical protein [Haematospirillum jordaniae]|uniref:Uncharacterized protein n=1 Tax=Haematospirillum jordaniae TaxID=1549855 RepID=A0A143DDP4_9PROT|nr:hypothetical protein [Haematospirillum jordaniae]AMW34871.1 hypothetical protein AY555_06420 [Haematospirillum jordaniae]NKD66673.1 hypothetical protein [Haematospirillum jordaniae]NKD81163.1 hypothetical protein [Haematospirillum jordaniae]NKD85170.1 hypothetical protein [Haematospirillum jordaniae]NKD89469.1 hypothetical protein [Haematospirillum jordaniae]
MKTAAHLVEEAALHGFRIARLLNANGTWQAAFRDDNGAVFAGSGGTLEAALYDALGNALTTGVKRGAGEA